MTRVLLVEDEEAYVDALTIGLEAEGFTVISATDGAQALALFRAEQPDIVLLDLMLPRISGVDVCREIRSISNVPVIMVTAKSSEIDTVVGLEVGADDYVTKPYRVRELIARMRAVLRRSEERAINEPDNREIVLVEGGVQIDVGRHEVSVRGEKIVLPLKEFELLHFLVQNAGRVMQRHTLIERVWGADYVGDTKTLDVHIKRLRRKVEVDPGSPELIVTIRGVGYKFVSAAA